MNFTKYSRVLVLTVTTILLSLAIWVSFYLNLPGKIGFPSTTLETIYANYDGPNYMIIAKCGYQKSCIASHFSLPLPLEYYPAHLPGFPYLIKYFSLYTTTPKAMLLVSLLGSIFLTLATYSFFKYFLSASSAFYLTLLSIFFPGRMLILRLVGAPETWFISLTLWSIVFFYRQKYLLSAVFAALAQVFKSPGILLFAAYGLMAIVELQHRQSLAAIVKKYLAYLLVPAVAIGIFYLYYLQTGDFWAYFHSGDNIHLNFLPYLVFISNHTWINTIWLEDVVYIYLLSFVAITRLVKKYHFHLVTLYPTIYTLAAIFVAHRDISRYLAPAYPFFILAFAKFLLRRNLKIIALILLPALILFSINFLIGNTAPIADWGPYL